MDVLDKIQSVFRDIFDDENLVITEETAASDIDGWDSFAQMQIIMGIEELFNIKFSTDDVIGLKNVGDIVKVVMKYI